MYNVSQTLQLKMCIYPCLTCSDFNFYSCLSCSNSSQVLTGSLCITAPPIYYQIASVCAVIFFILPVLMRKRCLTLIKILDYIQIAAYFKLINGYPTNRHVWLYLGMRSWGNWADGWEILSYDQTTPIWTNQQGVINKSIRIASTWALIIIIGLILGFLKIALEEKALTFKKYFSKNLGNIISFAYYFTLQDIAFVMAVPFMNPTFKYSWFTIGFILAVVFTLTTTLFIYWSFYRINYPDEQQKYYNYKYFFLLSADYDLFPTYSLLDLPTKAKQIKRYSNIRILDMLKKLAYAFLIVGYLGNSRYSTFTYNDEMFQIIAFLFFFEIVWLIIMPYNIERQYLQFAIGIISFGVTLYILIGFWKISHEIVNTIIVFCLFGLALLSLITEFFLSIYKIVPVDLYETGLKVVIEDPRLLKEIALRKQEQQEMERRLKEMQEQNQKLRLEMEQKYKSQQKINTSKQIREDSQISLPMQNQKKQLTDAPVDNGSVNNEQEQIERASMDSEEVAELYKVDELKRRKVYQWNKQKPFAYSNRMQ